MEMLAAKLSDGDESLRESDVATAGMMCEWWEQGISGTEDVRTSEDKARLQAMAKALRHS